MLTPEMIDIINNFSVGAVATVSKDGFARVSPKGTFLVWTSKELVFGDIRSPNTVANLKENPGVEVCFTDIFNRTSCRVTGLARYIPRQSSSYQDYLPRFSSAWPSLAPRIRGFVTVSVEGAALVKSPVYDIGSRSAELDEFWLSKYSTLISGRNNT